MDLACHHLETIWQEKTTWETSPTVERRPGQILERHDMAAESTRQGNLETACWGLRPTTGPNGCLMMMMMMMMVTWSAGFLPGLFVAPMYGVNAFWRRWWANWEDVWVMCTCVRVYCMLGLGIQRLDNSGWCLRHKYHYKYCNRCAQINTCTSLFFRVHTKYAINSTEQQA